MLPPIQRSTIGEHGACGSTTSLGPSKDMLMLIRSGCQRLLGGAQPCGSPPPRRPYPPSTSVRDRLRTCIAPMPDQCGSVPLSLLLRCNSHTCSLFIPQGMPHDGGSDPVKLLLDKYSSARFVRLLQLEGKVPVCNGRGAHTTARVRGVWGWGRVFICVGLSATHNQDAVKHMVSQGCEYCHMHRFLTPPSPLAETPYGCGLKECMG
jgi:hypothetical protein